MAKRQLSTICGYCGCSTDKASRDHAIPLALWPDGKRPQHPVIVPACVECHEEIDREVAYFRDMVVLMSDPDSHPLLESMASGPVAKNIGRDYNLWQQYIVGAEFAWKATESGLVFDSGFRVPFDSDRFCLSIDKIVRGLFYHKSQHPQSRSVSR